MNASLREKISLYYIQIGFIVKKSSSRFTQRTALFYMKNVIIV